MRIERLALERYGAFSDRELSFDPDARLHVVYGQNEAGKTSALSAIGDLLFGFPARTEYDFRHEGKALRVGGIIRSPNGELVHARRRKGNKNTLLDAGDQPLPDDRLNTLLGAVSRDMFFREFGLSAASLRAGGDELLSAGGRLAETLAAGSAGMAGLSDLQDRLRASADELFSSRRSGNKAFYIASDRREVADREFRDATITPEILRQVETAEKSAAAQLAKLTAEHAQSVGLLARWQRALRVRTQLARLEQIRGELAGLSDLPDVGQETVAAWQTLSEERAKLERQIGELDIEDKAGAGELEALFVDGPVLREGAAIEALHARLSAVRKAQDDLPRRKAGRVAAEAVLLDAAKKLGLPSHVELLSVMPTDPALADARVTINDVMRLRRQLEDASTRYTRLESELREAAANEIADEAVLDIEHLRQRFNALGDLHALQNHARREHAAISLERKSINDAAAALNPSLNSVESARSLQLPDPSTVTKFANAMELGEAEIERLQESVAGHARTISDLEEELARFASAGDVPTRSDLVKARSARDTQLSRLRTTLGGERSIQESLFTEFSSISANIDRLTDDLLNDTQRATRKEDAQVRLSEVVKQRDMEVDKLAILKGEFNNVVQDWKRTWLASGLEPLTPVLMQRWRERFGELVARINRCDVRLADLEAAEENLQAAKGGVIAFLQSTGRQCDTALPADILYAEARGRFDELLTVWGNERAREAEKNKLKRDLVQARDDQERIGSELDKALGRWQGVMTAIGLAESATPAYAEAAIAIWSAVGGPKVSFERETRSVETITKDLAEFDRDVTDLSNKIALDTGSMASEEIVGLLADRLADARLANENYLRLQAKAQDRAIRRNQLQAALDGGAPALEEACRAAHAENLERLGRQIERLGSRFALESERGGLHLLLLDIGDGNNEESLRVERDGVDLDELPGEIEREKISERRLLDDIRAAAVEHAQKRDEIEALTKGRDAIGAASRRMEAGTEMLGIAEQWLLRSTASLLARKAIEIHRSKTQDPTIARASELFSLATKKAFQGLGVSYDDDDQPVLVAQRNPDERVHIAGLSEGTRDQLFLALRLALLERRSSAPLPFIGDDLLTSFDDTRTLAGLELLAAAGENRQIILFTHHAFVADLAKSTRGHSVQVIQI